MSTADSTPFSTFEIPPSRRDIDKIDFLLSRPALALLSASLRPAARSFLTYLATLPSSAPHACPACESRAIYLAAPAGTYRRRRDGYRCRNCTKQFNVLTGTPLSRLRSEEKWKPWMSYRFQSFSQERIADFLNISYKASMTWSRAFTATLAEYDSELYRWWEEHQSTDISALTTEAEEALEQCITALTELRTLTDRHCPYCGSSSTQLVTSRRATEYQCHDCGRRYNNLTKTPLANLHHIDLWTDYVRLLVAGYHDNEIGERLDLSAALAGLWRPRFLQILQARWPLLAHWAIWQCSRRRVSQSRIT